MDIQTIVLIVVLSLLVGGTLIYSIIVLFKNNNLKKIYDCLKEAIKTAEQHSTWSGQEKKQYVLDQIEKKCHALGIPFKLLLRSIDKLIDTIIDNYNVIAK